MYLQIEAIDFGCCFKIPQVIPQSWVCQAGSVSLSCILQPLTVVELSSDRYQLLLRSSHLGLCICLGSHVDKTGSWMQCLIILGDTVSKQIFCPSLAFTISMPSLSMVLQVQEFLFINSLYISQGWHPQSARSLCFDQLWLSGQFDWAIAQDVLLFQ